MHFLKIFHQFGIRKIRLSGGEPLIYKKIWELIDIIHLDLKFNDIAITSNASLIMDHIDDIRKRPFLRWNLSLDALQPELFRKISGRNGLPSSLQGINWLLKHSGRPIKINMVVMKNINDDQIIPMINHFENKELELRFIEFMPFDDGEHWSDSRYFSAAEMEKAIQGSFRLDKVESKGKNVHKAYKIRGEKLRIGIIPAYSRAFCHSCDRIRLDSSGDLSHCLYSRQKLHLKELLRNASADQEIIAEIKAYLRTKAVDGKSAEQLNPDTAAGQRISMNRIGG